MSKWLLYLVTLLAILCAVSVEGRRRRRCSPGQKVYDSCRRLCVCGVDNTLTECTRLRKEFTSMSNRERRQYIRAVKTISTDDRYKDKYNKLITLHIRQFMSGIHDMKHFLTWHRLYLLRYENLLREVNCKVTVPYWDWSISSGDPWGTETGDLWCSGSTGLGGNGNSSNGFCVSDGPFASEAWHLVPAANPGCQRRRFSGYPPDAVAVAELLDIDPANFTDFETILRVNYHNTVHCLIGGTMCSLDSSCAPEFFFHHAFIDKIWADWQNKSNEHKNVFFGSLTEALPALPDSYYHLMPSEVLDNMALPGETGVIRVDYLDVNDTETASFVKRLRRLRPKQLQKIARPDFDAINEDSLKLFHVDLKDVRRARREERRVRPKNKRDRKKLRTRKGRKFGLELSDIEEAEKEEKEEKEKSEESEESEDKQDKGESYGDKEEKDNLLKKLFA